MIVRKIFFVVNLSILLSSVATICILNTVSVAQTVDSRIALQRGYRTGYSDGYMAGYRDTIDSISKDISRHAEYIKADRAFNRDYGSLQDYRDGYQQGFESGYDTGFEKRSFEATLPADLKKRGAARDSSQELMAENKTVKDSPPVTAGEQSQQNSNEPVARTTEDPVAVQFQATAGNPVIMIPRETELILEIQEDLNTQTTREGERFTAKVTSPSEIAGATIEGRVTKVRQPGRIKRRSELVLSFDRIVLNESRWSNFSAILVEVMPVKGDNISRVDSEGTAVGQSSLKQDALKVGGTTGAGLVIGAVAGGPVGAAVGAGIGAAFGVGAVVIERGKHVRLNRNQQIRIKTAYETQIR
jgi:uncharacterized protein YcfJ